MMTYDKFIQDILDTRGRFGIPVGEYKERHHITPKCLGGTNDEANLIDLYAMDHFEAHRLLAIENKDKHELTYAYHLMTTVANKYENRYVATSEEYEESRKLYSEMLKSRIGESHPLHGRKYPPEYGKRISERKKGRKLSDSAKENIRIGHLGLASGGNNPMAKQVVCDGKIFDCIQDCADYYDVTVGSMKMWLRGANKMPQLFIDMGLHYIGEEDRIYIPQTGLPKGRNHPNAKPVICNNVIYDTLTECATTYEIPIATMNGWLKGRNKMPAHFVDMWLAYYKGGDKEGC